MRGINPLQSLTHHLEIIGSIFPAIQVRTELSRQFPGSTQTQAPLHWEQSGYGIAVVQTPFWKFSLAEGHAHEKVM